MIRNNSKGTYGETGRDEWIRLHQIETDDRFEPMGKQSIDDGKIRRKIMQYTNGREPHEIGSSDMVYLPFLQRYQ